MLTNIHELTKKSYFFKKQFREKVSFTKTNGKAS